MNIFNDDCWFSLEKWWCAQVKLWSRADEGKEMKERQCLPLGNWPGREMGGFLNPHVGAGFGILESDGAGKMWSSGFIKSRNTF